ncbi:hypothetical protein MHYP_G00121420 [Metynnis hypsauchen]
MLSTSLQKESPGDVSPAEIFIANSKVKEGQEVKCKCRVTDVRKHRVYVHLCRSGTTVKTAELEESKDDTMLVFDKVTVKDSGLYTCVYSVEKDAACKMNITGRNSASLEVSGAHPVDQSHQPPSTGQPCHTVNAVYATVQKRKGKEGKNAESFNSSSETPAGYSLAQWCEEMTEQPAGYYAEIH